MCEDGELLEVFQARWVFGVILFQMILVSRLDDQANHPRRVASDTFFLQLSNSRHKPRPGNRRLFRNFLGAPLQPHRAPRAFQRGVALSVSSLRDSVPELDPATTLFLT